MYQSSVPNVPGSSLINTVNMAGNPVTASTSPAPYAFIIQLLTGPTSTWYGECATGSPQYMTDTECLPAVDGT